MPTFDYICEVCGHQDRAYRTDDPPRFCSRKCRNQGKVKGKNTKWIITPDMHEQIRTAYQGPTGSGEIKALAKKLGLPRWKLTRYATEHGWIARTKKEPDWSERELRMLETTAHRSPATIRRYLARVGFHRSELAIVLKRKRMRFLKNLHGHSARDVARCLGIDDHTVTRWISLGYLKAMRRGTERTREQGGDHYFIRDQWIRKFVIEYLSEIDFRKLDKYWLVDILVGDQRDEMQADSEEVPGADWYAGHRID
jgi:Homeodomain-like domain